MLGKGNCTITSPSQRPRRGVGVGSRRSVLVLLLYLSLSSLLFASVHRASVHWNLDPDIVVLFLNFLQDVSGEQFTSSRILRTVSSAGPIYGTFSAFVGSGIVGGSVADLRDAGRILGQDGLRIPNGEKVENMPVTTAEFQHYVFDWHQLHRWAISAVRLPAESAVQYWQYSPSELYRWIIWGLVAILVVENLLIILLRSREKRRHAEGALHEGGQRFDLIANNLPVMIWMSDTDRRFTYFNRSWLEFTGRPLETQIGNAWTEAIHSEDRAMYLDSYAAIFDRRLPFNLQYRLRRHDGQYRWVSDRGVPRSNIDGSFAGYIGCCIDMTDEREARAGLATLGGRLIQAQEEERARVARELHDDISQKLALLANRFQELKYAVRESGRVEEEQFAELSELTNEIAADIQRISHQLHPSKLQYLGLPGSVRELCREFSRQHKIETECVVRDLPQDLNDSISLSLFRTIQEALRNVAKHSRAHHVKVELTCVSGMAGLRVSDDGVGFDPGQTGRFGLGLVSMRERLRLIGGQFSVLSGPSLGTKVEATVPVKLRVRSA